MDVINVVLGFVDGHYFIGKQADDLLYDCLVLVYNNDEKGTGVNFVNPIPFGFEQNDIGELYLPDIDISKFTYHINLNSDIKNAEAMIKYYHESVEYEKTKKQDHNLG